MGWRTLSPPIRWVFPLLAVLVLSACGSLAGLADRIVLQPAGQVARALGLGSDPAADACTRMASQVNPATLAPGLGGTGAPASSAAANPGGIGGTGQVAQRPGLGGTGQVAEGGLGGTGIVGVVTGFGSICVNGVKVEFDGGTPVQRDGRPSSLNELAVGQVVALRAQGSGERFQAERIAVLDAVVGPLGMLDRSTGRLEVMGQRVTALEVQDLEGVGVGDWVRVSGQRRADGEIRASRVQAVPPGEALLVGTASRAPDGWRIGDARLELGSQASTAGWRDGGELRVRGQWDGGRLQVRDAQTDPTRTALGAVHDVVYQGYVHELRGRELSLGFESLSLARVLEVLGGQLETLRAGQPVLVRGRVDADQRVVVDRLEFRNEGRRGGGRSGRSSSDDRDSDDSRSGSDDSSNSGSGSSGSSGGDSGGQGRGRGRGRGGD
jgi:hypothetical protein